MLETTLTQRIEKYQQRGQLKTIGNLEVYESRPAAEDVKGLLLLLPDGFGIAMHNIILADMFAERGWVVLIPDYFQGLPEFPKHELSRIGNPLLVSLLQRAPGTPLEAIVDMKEWLGRHSAQVVRELLASFVENLQTSLPEMEILGKNRLSVVGYCFGGKYAIQLSSWAGVRAAAAFHPDTNKMVPQSFVQGSDLAPGENTDAAPILVGLAQNDSMVPLTLSDDLNRWASSHGRILEQRTFPNVGHGFAARPNTKDEVERGQFEDAFMYANEFLLRL